MKNAIFTVALAAMLTVPGAAMAAPTKADTKAASAECHALREAAGKENFKATYGNMGKCVSQKSREEARERKASRKAAKEACEAQGLKGKEKAACVRETAKEEKAEKDAKDEKRINASKACRAEQKDDPDTFAATYGDGKNAFGKCASAKAKAQNDDETDQDS
ncbi:MAG TPA: hypothetical protein VD790_03890 [Thermoleophilaceae bacterium]|nr:hypothetical protein [Thermoleophilaceae bacterium]